MDPAHFRETVVQTCTEQGIRPDANPLVTIRLRGLAFGYDETHDPPGAPSEGPPTIAADLDVRETVARGGQGWIRLAQQRSLERDVVVKTLLPGRGDPRALVREARLTGRLEHPNIVPVHGLAWRDGEGPALVMKRIEGDVWLDRLHARPDDLVAHLEVLMDVCRAVHFAHSRGVLHRDIKPDNVMVGAHGEVYLLDWGVAQQVDEPAVGGIAGTPCYMAPEQVAGGPLDARTDVFLLGACLHVVLTGEPPHRGRDTHDVLVAAALCAPFVYADAVDPELAAVAARATAADPGARYPTARALREALAAHLQHRSSVETTHRASEDLLILRAQVAEATDPLAVHQQFGVTRAGFDQALRQWPANAAAAAGLRATLEVMAAHELDADNPAAAAALLAEHGAPPPALLARVEAVREAAAARARASEDLAALLRFKGVGWARTWITVLNAFLTGGALLVAALWVGDGATVTPAANAGFMAVSTVFIWAGIWVFRRFILDSRLYQIVMAALAALGPLLLVNRLFGWLVGATFAQVLAADLAVAVGVSVMLAVSASPIFWVSVAIAAGFGTLALTFADHALATIAVAYFLNDLWLAWCLRPTDPGGQST